MTVTLYGSYLRRLEQKRRASFLTNRESTSLNGIRAEYFNRITTEGVIVVAMDMLNIKLITKQAMKWLFRGSSSLSLIDDQTKKNLLTKIVVAFTNSIPELDKKNLGKIEEKAMALSTYIEQQGIA